jgi:hypothetical protein
MTCELQIRFIDKVLLKTTKESLSFEMIRASCEFVQVQIEDDERVVVSTRR